MSSSPIKASKLTIIRMDVVISDIYRIWKSVDSEYVNGRRKLSDARSLLYSDTKKAYKLLCKARDDIIEESKAAQEYNHFKGIITQIDDKEVSELNRKYKDQLVSGDFKKARETAIKISQCRIIKDSSHSIDVKMDSESGKSISFTLSNSSAKSIVVKRFAAYIGESQLGSNTVYPFTIHHNSTMRISFSKDDREGSKVAVILEYSEDGIVKTISFESPLTGGK